MFDGVDRDILNKAIAIEPNDIPNPLIFAVDRLFGCLNLQLYIEDVLNITELKKNKNDTDKLSIKVLFKSNYVRDFILSQKRFVGEITTTQIFGDSVGNNIVYMYELLNRQTYDLFRKAKSMKKDYN